MSNPTPIETVVMRRVWRMRRLQQMSHPLAWSAAVLVLALHSIGREVWVARVLDNAPDALHLVPQFYLAAFTETQVVVQFWVLLGGGALLALAHTLARELVRYGILRTH